MKDPLAVAAIVLLIVASAFATELLPIQPMNVTSLTLTTFRDPNPSSKKDGSCALDGKRAQAFLKSIGLGAPFRPDAFPAAIVTGKLVLTHSGRQRSFRIYNEELLYEDMMWFPS